MRDAPRRKIPRKNAGEYEVEHIWRSMNWEIVRCQIIEVFEQIDKFYGQMMSRMVCGRSVVAREKYWMLEYLRRSPSPPLSQWPPIADLLCSPGTEALILIVVQWQLIRRQTLRHVFTSEWEWKYCCIVCYITLFLFLIYDIYCSYVFITLRQTYLELLQGQISKSRRPTWAGISIWLYLFRRRKPRFVVWKKKSQCVESLLGLTVVF
jgi:hypothetical protein